MKQITKFIILVMFTQSIALGTYAFGFSFEGDDIVMHTSHTESQLDTELCDEMTECDNNCYDCCNCIMLLQSNFDNHFNLQSLNNFPFQASLNNLPTFLYKPPCSLQS